jgi:two-component system cell cycle response regulator
LSQVQTLLLLDLDPAAFQAAGYEATLGTNWRSLYDLMELKSFFAVVVPCDHLFQQNDNIDRFIQFANSKQVPILAYIDPATHLQPSAYYSHLSGLLCEPLSKGLIRELIGYAAEIGGRKNDIILAVDDSRTARGILQRELTPDGFAVFFACDGVHAQRLAAAIAPRVIITDLLMPEVDGYELCRQLADSEETAHIPVVVITSLDPTEMLKKGFSAGVKEYFSKPWPAKKLLQFVKRLMLDMSYRRSETALVVEDSATIRRLVGHYLSKLGFEIIEYDHGQELLDHIKGEAKTADLVVMDWELPDVDGLSMLKQLRQQKNYRMVPIVMLTGRSADHDIAMALRSGADDYITKPFNFEELAARIQAHMRVKRMIDELNEKNRLLEELALTDSLTGLYNRRHFDQQLDTTWAQHVRGHHGLALMMIDIDHFKSINDRYGHQAGDQVLKHLAGLLKDTCRRGDIICRIGGEEFAVILAETTSEEGWAVAERLRLQAQESNNEFYGSEVGYTLSVGMADSAHPEMETISDLLQKCDKALYDAKNNGRNQVRIYQ